MEACQGFFRIYALCFACVILTLKTITKKSLKDHHNMSNSEPEVDWAVFIPAVIIVLVCAIPLMIFPESA